MKIIPQLPFTRAFRFRGTFLALLTANLAAGLVATHAAPPSVQPLVHPGQWPAGSQAPTVDVAVSGNYAYVAHGGLGLQVIDVSAPQVAVDAGRVYVAAGWAGLVVLPTLPNVQFTVRVHATPGAPFTLEAATNLSAPNPWTPLLTTTVPAMPFDYVDFDVKLSERPQKYYRVRQP